MRQLASQYGVRVADATRRPGYDDDDDDEEAWEDVVGDLGNPLDMRPARVGLFEDDLDDGRLPLPPLPDSVAPAAPSGPAYLDPSALPRMGPTELGQLLGTAAAAAEEGRAVAVVVDVRELDEQPGPQPSLPAPASSAPLRRVPLSALRRPEAEALAAEGDWVVVLGSGDHRGEQAVVRLTRVYGLRRVVLYDEAQG
ncbi:hypothetical protein HYH03_009366 [Edaphochlamys debaryana]|uniref:Rhodanese domain-containing protein n=1 Tax=Edaphochlamys debaryana TaxID=47281 RepID=A0A835XY83_9CHLO|nr:hypothetical protein HYH03_009366 [Edaphochlamys debaryana]|eukprot:KAG2492423.1 hypothetical protein HYH03_009366 [Edaphochlamys debaryana]